MKNVRVIISGFVQGIGFRHFVKKEAEKLGLTGWVRNASDNKVEGVFQSSASSDQVAQEELEKMIEVCKKGPLLAEVEDVAVQWEEEREKFENFEIIL